MIALLLLLAAPDLSGVLRLSGTSSSAHACPISMNLALTSKHVVMAYSEMIWGINDGEKHSGIVKSEWADAFRDLAHIVPISAQRFPRWYPIAEKAPSVGDKVYFLGFDFSNKKDAFAPKEFRGTVTRLFNGTLIFDPAGKPGSSGSCVLNEAGEVVAINQGAQEVADKSDVVGLAVAVWGQWLNLRKDDVVVEMPSNEE